MALLNEIMCLYLGEINFIYMFRVWGLSMLKFASGIVGGSEVKLRQQKGVPEGVAAIEDLRHNAYRHFDMPLTTSRIKSLSIYPT